jgi:hypothetical protein
MSWPMSCLIWSMDGRSRSRRGLCCCARSSDRPDDRAAQAKARRERADPRSGTCGRSRRVQAAGSDVITGALGTGCRPRASRPSACWALARRAGRVEVVRRPRGPRRDGSRERIRGSRSRLSFDGLLPVTDASTARQKVQRSFSREFLSPVDALAAMLPLPYPSDSDLEAVADHFEVSEFTVRSALVNRGLVDRHFLPGFRRG